MMKSILISALFFWSQISIAADPPVSLKGQLSAAKNLPAWNLETPMNQSTKTGGINALIETGNFNLLSNPGFEHSTFSTSWTASGGSSTVGTSTNIGTGLKSYAWDASASSQTLTSDVVAIPAGFYGQPAEVSCRFKTAATDYIIHAYDGTNVIASKTISSGSVFTVQSTAAFNFPSTGNIQLRIVSASDAAVIYVDDCYVGPSRITGNYQSAQLLGGVKITGCAGAWDNTSTTFANFPVQTTCVYTPYGNASAPSTMLPAITFSQVPAGNILLIYEGRLTSNSGGTSYGYRFHDGTNAAIEESSFTQANSTNGATSTITGSFNYTTPQYNITFNIQGKTSTGDNYITGTTAIPSAIKVYWFPSSAQASLTQNTTPAYWSGYHGSTTWSRTNASYGDYGTASATLTTRQSSNISCTGSGTVLPSITCSLPNAGAYYLCAIPTVQATTNNAQTSLRLWNGSVSLFETSVTNTTGTNSSTFSVPMCTVVNASSTSATWTIQSAVSTGTTFITPVNSNASIEWSVLSITQPFPAPLLIGSVTSSSSGVERIERASISCGNSGSSINSQSGNWASITNGGSAGQCTVSFNFPSAPTCIVSVERTPIPTSQTWGVVVTVSSTSVVLQRTVNGVDLNGAMQLICMGPK